ncbi:UNVERIFIED_CONTAM: hypothetical protein Slati_4569300 [Sesamum latifolium]|uniref:Uncharacterized protein n=1 Tax=Sesamum latifolium TaxID=2727402 RepID=A0AAW2SG43_9LAMI
MLGRSHEQRGNIGPKNFMRCKGPVDKRNLFCDNCNKSGHSKETCFKIHSVPDLYKDLSEQRRKNRTGGRAYAVTDFEQQTVVEKSNMVASNNLVVELVESPRIMQNKIPLDPDMKTRNILAIGKQIGNLYF